MAELELPLFAIYDAVRAVAVEVFRIKNVDPGLPPVVPARLEDAWCSVDTGARKPVRLALSTEGQVRYSLRRIRTSHPAQINPDADFWSVATDVSDFMDIVRRLHAEIKQDVAGLISFELREIRDWQMHFHAEDLFTRNDTNTGVADKDAILSGDFPWTTALDSARVAADCMGELAIQFPNSDGTRPRFDHAALARHVRLGNEHRRKIERSESES